MHICCDVTRFPVQRAFTERSVETRKLSAQIIGGMCSRNQALCSGQDLAPYLTHIMPGLRLTLTDPVPDVRATAAKVGFVLAHMVKNKGFLMESFEAETYVIDPSDYENDV